MGSYSSKVASKAAGAARRQYPSTSSVLNSAPSTGPTPSSSPASRTTSEPLQSSQLDTSAASQVRPNPSASPPVGQKSEHIELDGRDPHFGSALRKIGPARPAPEIPSEESFPTSSQPMQTGHNIFPSSTNNPAVLLVQARGRINKQWEFETGNRGRPSFAGTTMLSAKDIREALTLRDERGETSQEVERKMKLKPGLLDQLAPKEVVANA